LNWLFEKTDDLSLDDPLPQASKPKAGGIHVSDSHIESLMGMGFTADQSRLALTKCDNNPERAIEYLFSHDMEQEAKEVAAESNVMQIEEPKDVKYDLEGCIVHLGSSYHAGHYVAYIKKNNEWVLYNDAKVAKSTEPALGKGTLYLFRKVD